MIVLTIYCHDTGGTRLKPSADVVGTYANADPTNEYELSIQAEGTVLKAGKHEAHKWHVDVRDGVLVRVSDDKDKSIERLLALKLPAAMVKGYPVPDPAGPVALHAVRDVCVALEYLVHANKIPQRIDIMGAGRGAATALRISHELFTNDAGFLQSPEAAKKLRAILLNIITIDPVFAPGEPEAHTVHENAKSFVGLFTLHENRWKLPAMDETKLQVADRTNAVFLAFPGILGDLATDKTPTGKIAFALVHDFLKFHGTKITLAKYHAASHALFESYCLAKYPDAKAINAFRALVTAEAAAPEQRKRDWLAHVSTALGRRARVHDRQHLATDTFFLNHHHELVWRKLFPLSYDAYFGKGKGTRNTDPWAAEWKPKIEGELHTLGATVAGGLEVGAVERAALERLGPSPLRYEAGRLQAVTRGLQLNGLLPT